MDFYQRALGRDQKNLFSGTGYAQYGKHDDVVFDIDCGSRDRDIRGAVFNRLDHNGRDIGQWYGCMGMTCCRPQQGSENQQGRISGQTGRAYGLQ